MNQDQKANQDQKFEINGKVYTLRFSIKAMAVLQDHYGVKSIQEVGKRMSDQSSLGIPDFVAIMWAGLQRHHPEMTKESVLDLLDDLGMESMQGILGDAVYAGMPSEQEATEKAEASDRPTNP